MRTNFVCLAAVLVTAANNASADTSSDVVDDVRTVCTQPATQGKHWEVTGDLKGDVGIQLKLLKVAGIEGNLHFSKSEWAGVQRVLAEQQGADNADFRACVRQLAPLFIDKAFPKAQVKEESSGEAKSAASK
jgi:hypothetical protein